MPNRPRGTRDFAPAEAEARQRMASRMRKVFRQFGYNEVQTPTFEELELFTAKSGDGIIKELYNFKDKGERDLALRPELTAPVMRMVYQDHAFDPKPLKWFYFGNCFRYDRPQSGRYREFWQFGCEQVGAGTPLAHAELITLGDSLLAAVGLENRELAVGHVAILAQLVDGLKAPDRGVVMRAIDKGDLDALKAAAPPGPALTKLLAAISATSIDEARKTIGDSAELDELAEVFARLEDFGTEARLNLGIARGLDYYNGVVFEIHCPALEAQSQLLGGGAYDLSAIFNAKPMPTMGFGLGFDRTLVALGAEGKTPDPVAGADVYFGALGDAAQKLVLQGVTRMRKFGVRVELDLMGRKPSQIAKAADTGGARFLVIVGERDMEGGQCQVKNLKTGASTDMAMDGLIDWLLEQVGVENYSDYN